MIKVYENFLRKYPDFVSLLSSNIDELEIVLRPLGLQKQRAKQLLEISSYITTKYNNQIPKSEKKLLKIPGIGQYSARAIQSFAYNIRSYPIDSNVQRVLSRVFIQNDWKNVSNTKIEEVFKSVQPIRDFRNFNFYLLDFGSLICRAAYPKCSVCPVSTICISINIY